MMTKAFDLYVKLFSLVQTLQLVSKRKENSYNNNTSSPVRPLLNITTVVSNSAHGCG